MPTGFHRPNEALLLGAQLNSERERNAEIGESLPRAEPQAARYPVGWEADRVSLLSHGIRIDPSPSLRVVVRSPTAWTHW
jgi:hypothetical protein